MGAPQGFPDYLVPILAIEYTKPNDGAGSGFMLVFRHVVASIAPTQKSVPRSFSAEINTFIPSGRTPAISEP